MSLRRSRHGAGTTVLAGRVALAAAVLGATGCSVAGTDFQPGVAAEVDGATLSSGTVDEYATFFCEALETGAFGEVGAVARGELKQGVAGNLARRLAAEQFAEDYGVAAGAYYEEVRTQARQGFAAVPEDARDALVEVQASDAYVNAVALEAGEDALAAEGDEVGPEAAQQRGLELFAQWLADREVEIDPSLGLELAEDGSWVPLDTSTSVAGSGAALVADAEPVDGAGQPNPEYSSYVASLPASQRCGG